VRRDRSPARLGIPLALAIALGLAASPAAAERVRVALLPVVVHSSESREYLQQGLSDMLVARLGRDPRLAVIEVEDPAAATSDTAAARAAARKAGATYVVYGSFTRFGEGASLDLQCASAAEDGPEPRKIPAYSATLGGLIPMLEGVSEKVTAYVTGTDRGAAAPAAAPAGGAERGEVGDLKRRVEALERAVFSSGAAKDVPSEPSTRPQIGVDQGAPDATTDPDRDVGGVR
jgi:TolB-like protein